MYRKNRVLKRPAFAMIMAITVLVVMATIMAYSIQRSAITKKRVVEIYIKNQAELYAKNTAEFAKLLIAENNTPCIPVQINDFAFDGQGNPKAYTDANAMYKIKVDLKYAYSNHDCGTGNYIRLNAAPLDYEYGYVRIDVAVEVDPDQYNGERIRVFRRFIEDITPYL